MPQTLRESDRLKLQKDLRKVFAHGRSAADAALRLHVLANSLGRSRMAVTVSGRHGKPVRRNRIKRLCREAFRTSREDLPVGYDYVLRPRVGAALSVETIRRSLTGLARRLIKDAPQ